MASNFIARFTGSNNPSGSIYETIRQHDQDSDGSDLEERAGLVPDSRPYRDSFEDQDSIPPSFHPTRTLPSSRQNVRRDKGKVVNRQRWKTLKSQRLMEVEEADDDVPASLLIEDAAGGHRSIALPPPPSLVPDDLTFSHPEPAPQTTRRGAPGSNGHRPAMATNLWGSLANQDPKEKAMFRWVNVLNLDNFLLEVYSYYICHGFWSTILMRFFNIVTIGFIVGFSLFLTQCIDYSDFRGKTRMSEILIPQCASKMGFLPNVLLWLTSFIWLWKSVGYIIDIPRLRHMHDFYLYLLGIPEDEIQSISWQEVVSRLMALRDSNPNTADAPDTKRGGWIRTQSKQRMDAHDIASRLMRRQNYMIALINKDILDLTLPVPFLRNRRLFTRTLEWSIDLCIMDFIFNDKGQVRSLFLKDTHRKDLSQALRTRFIMTGVASLIFAPFLAAFFVVKHIFLNFNEYQKNPAQIGTREYNPYAEWKFREFNELYHLFQRRIFMSYPFASRYINQFPKDKTVQAAQLVTLVSGAVVSVLGLATVLDQENFLNFEITSGRTTIFYLGVFGSIWAVARGMLPDDNMIYDTSNSLQEVIDYTHYEPAHWKGRLHTTDVKQEFSQLYQMKVVIFVEEVLSMIFTPFVLCFSLPNCSERIIDFFREFTIHVDGIGYVCSFAEFGFSRPGTKPVTTDPTKTARDEYFASKDNKLEHSYWGFINDYARNPKTDVRFNYNTSKRHFNMPPPAPGLPSPTFPSLDRDLTFNSGSHKAAILSPTQRGLSNVQRLPAQQQSLGSPLQSLLLDPHHQPSASGFTSSPQTQRNSRGGQGSLLGKARRVTLPAEVAEKGEAENEGRAQARRRAEMSSRDEGPGLRRGIAAEVPAGTVASCSAAGLGLGATVTGTVNQSEGELGSWKYENDSGDGDTAESDDDDTNVDKLTHGGPLGLMLQFQRAHQGEVRNAGGAGGTGI